MSSELGNLAASLGKQAVQAVATAHSEGKIENAHNLLTLASQLLGSNNKLVNGIKTVTGAINGMDADELATHGLTKDIVLKLTKNATTGILESSLAKTGLPVTDDHRALIQSSLDAASKHAESILGKGVAGVKEIRSNGLPPEIKDQATKAMRGMLDNLSVKGGVIGAAANAVKNASPLLDAFKEPKYVVAPVNEISPPMGGKGKTISLGRT